MSTILSLCLGLGLSAACGFRVFVPLLIMGLASSSGHLQLAEPFQWIGSSPAMLAFGAATVLEIGGYYIPWLDNLLDVAAGPSALIAGIITTASCVVDVDPMMRWTLAAVLGGGSAVAVQAGTSVIRAASTVTTGGLGNPLVSTAEAGGSIALSLIALVAPILAVILLVGLVVIGVSTWRRRRQRRLRLGDSTS